MEVKRIWVLANSIKKGGRCVAGREVRRGPDGRHLLGAWVRPIGTSGSEGELHPDDMRIGSRPLEPREVVDVPVSGNANDPAHPEDWAVTGEEWGRVERPADLALSDAIETPPDLWLEDPRHADRVAPAFLAGRLSHQSIYLVRPTGLRVACSQQTNPYKSKVQKKTRARFSYGGSEYDLGLTDPIVSDALTGRFPPEGAPPVEIPAKHPDRCVICVSLTPVFEGYHYKVVATVLELP